MAQLTQERADDIRRQAERHIAGLARLSLDDTTKRAAFEAYRDQVIAARQEMRAFDHLPAIQEYLRALCQPGDPNYDWDNPRPGTRPFLAGFWFWLRTFGVLYEGRSILKTGQSVYLPFVPFFHQDRILTQVWDAILAGEQALVFKPRDVGVTLALLHVIAYIVLFVRDAEVLVGSRIDDLVDAVPGSFNRQTLFGRLEMILAAQPDYLLPRTFDLTNRLCRQKNYLRNPATQTVVHGESSNPNFGRQERVFLVFVDELDFWEHAPQVVGSLRDSTSSVIYASTANKDRGDASIVKRMKDEGKGRLIEVSLFEHPYKDQAWYAAQAGERFEEDIASELDMSWDAPDKDLIYPTWKQVPLGAFPYRPDWPTTIALDYGRSDGTAIDWVQRNPITGTRRWLACYYNLGQNIGFYLPFLGRPLTSGAYDYTEDDLRLVEIVAPFARGARFVGDPSGEQTHQAADLSVAQQLRGAGIHVQINPALNRHAQRQNRLREVLQRSECNLPLCGLLNAAFRNYKRQRWRPGMVNVTRRPIHNWASHPVTAGEYYAVTEAELGGQETQPAPERHKAAYEKRR